jgi:hypothetical protein
LNVNEIPCWELGLLGSTGTWKKDSTFVEATTTRVSLAWFLLRYRRTQSALDAAGVTATALFSVATHAPGRQGNSAAAAIELLQEMLNGGNDQVTANTWERHASF